MNRIYTALFVLLLTFSLNGKAHDKVEPVDSLEKILNFHFVSERLASSGLLHLKDYDYIKEYGFKHVINLIPGDQADERKRVESLGLSYDQIEIIWNDPTLENFETFVGLMKKYGNDKVYVHCQMNWRASSYLYLYRVTQLGVQKEVALKDLHRVWKPSETWQGFIDKVEFAYSK